MTTLTVSDRTAAELKGDALVLVSVQTEQGAALAPGHGLGEETVAHLESALSTLKAKGGADEVVKLVSVPGVTAALVVVTGAGKVATKGAAARSRGHPSRRRVSHASAQWSGQGRRAGPRRQVWPRPPPPRRARLFGAYTITSAAAGPTSAPVKSLTVVTPAARDRGPARRDQAGHRPGRGHDLRPRPGQPGPQRPLPGDVRRADQEARGRQRRQGLGARRERSGPVAPSAAT